MSENQSTEHIVSCGTTLEIGEVIDLRERLVAALDTGGSVFLDASTVEKPATSGLQLLVAFANDAREKKVTFRWGSPTEELIAAARLLDFDRALALPDAPGGTE